MRVEKEQLMLLGKSLLVDVISTEIIRDNQKLAELYFYYSNHHGIVSMGFRKENEDFFIGFISRKLCSFGASEECMDD